MEDQSRCEIEMDVTQINDNGRQIGTWLCCLPCDWLRRNSGFHKMSLTFATLLVTVVLVASPVIFLISTIPGDKYRDCSHRDNNCGRRDNKKVCTEEQCSAAASRILDSISSDTNPCQDFYHFACGSWGKTSSKFPGENLTGVHEDHFVNFVTLQKQVDRTVQQLLAVTTNSDPFEKLGSFYESCIRAADKRTSLLPMFSLLEDLGGYVAPAAEPREDLTNLVLNLLRLNGAPLFDIYWDLDLDNSSKLAPLIDLPLRVGFSLASKQWWRTSNKIPRSFREMALETLPPGSASGSYLKEGQGRAYNYIKASLEEKRLVIMERIMRDFISQNVSRETRMSETQTTLHFANMITKLYPREKEVMKSYQGEVNVKMKLEEIERKYPFIRWQYLLEKFLHVQLTSNDHVFILVPEYLNSLQRILPRFSSRVVHNGLLLIFATDNLYELANTSSTPDRPAFCSRLTVSVFSKAVSILYVRQYTPEYIDRLRTRIIQVFNTLKKSFERRIEMVSWLDKSARTAVYQKLAALRVQFLTWPNFWNTSYVSSLMKDVVVDPEDFFGNVVRRYRHLRNIPADLKRRQFMEERWAYPLVVNAFYILTANTIIIPLALMTQPYFREDVPLYIPYSTIGLIFAHEILHGFDLKGIGYDSNGKPGVLLPPEARAKLEARLDCFVKQFSSSFWKKVNFLGRSVDIQFDWNLTKNENMADISGLQIAFQAWKSVTKSGNEAYLPGIDFSPQQLFFLNAAQTYCAMLSPADYIFLVEMDFHTPHPERVNGIMMNSPGFAEAFKCPLGSPMNPRRKCLTWIELRAVLLSCPVKDSGCDDDDPLSQAMSIEEEDIESKTKKYEAMKDDEKNFPSIVKDCKRKLIITVKIKNTGKISCDDEYIVVDHVFDPLTGGKGRLLSPMILKLRQEQMIQLYALKFQRVVNSDPYEEHKEPDREACSVAAENPTCGTTMYDGKPIPFSEGFCCSRDPFLNTKRQLTPSPRKDSIFHRDSKLIPQGAERFIREQTSDTTIANPRLVKLKSGADTDTNAMSKDDTKEDLRVKDLTDAEKIPNFMLELDRKIVCDKGDFMKELCKMEQDKVKTLTTPEPFGGPTKAEATTVTSKSEGEKSKNKGHKAPKSNEQEYVTIPIVVTDENQNEILLKNLLQALNKNNEDRNKVSGPPPIRKLSEIYNQLKSGEGVRGKRENPMESSMPRSGRKLTLEENLENFINMKKGLRNRRKRLLELSHKRFHKAGIHCRDLADCPTIMVTEFPNDFIRSPPPSYFFAHDKTIIDPMDPSQLISNSTCRSYEDSYYDESSSSYPTQVQKEFPYKNEKGETPMPYNPTKYCENIQTKPKEKHQKASKEKNEKNPHPAGGQTQNDVPSGKKNVEELNKSHVGKNFLRGDKRLSFEESNNHEYKGINELLVKRGRKEENAGRPVAEEKLEEIHIRNYKPQKPHFKSKDIKDLLLKSDEKKISKSKIRNFMLAKNREKQKFKSEFRKIPKKEEETIREDSEKSNEYKKGAHPEENTSDVDVEESVDEGKEEQPLSNTPAGELEHGINGQHENQDGRDDEKSEFEEQEKSKFLQLQREGKLRKQGTPMRGKDEENTGSVDFDVEIIREGHPTFRKNIHYSTNVDKFSANRLKANANRRRLETYLMNHLNRNAHQLNGKNFAFQYRYPQRYDFSQKGHFIDKHTRLNPEVMMTHRFYVNEPELADHHSMRINNRGQQKHAYYHVKPLKNHRISVVDYTDHNSKLQRQSLLNDYDNNKLHNSQHQGKHQREIFSREYERPKADILINNDDQDLEEPTNGKIRNKRTVGYSFEPARGFLTSELNVFEGEGEPKLKDITVVHELEGCLSEGVANRREETDTWTKKVASRELAQAKPKIYNVSAEIMIPTLQKLKEKLDNHDALANFGGHKDKERLIQSYLNAPDYVLEEVEAGLKEKREVSDQGKRVSFKGSSAFDKDSLDFSPDTAHCMRYGDLWYSLYMIKKPVVAQIVGIQLFDKHTVCDGSSQWRDLTKGKMIRIGTFLPKAEDDLPTISMTFTGEKMKKIQSAIDSDKYVLLIPSHVSDPSKTSFYPQFEGGPEEYMVVQSKDISSGGDCNMIGTSFEAFARQPRRCEQRKGSCLKRQPVDLWREDMEARIRGKRGKYFVENFGKIPNSPVKSYTNLSGEFLALEYYGEYSGTIEIEVKADNNAIVTKRARAQIPTVYIDGTYPKKARIILSVLNIGLTSTYFRPRLGDCPPDLDPAWCPLEGPLVTIPPQQRHDFKLDLSGVLPPNKIHVTVQVLNQLNKKIAYRRIIIKKGDRCVCAFHCKCTCIGNAIAGRTCRKLTPQEYKGAGYVGSFPVRGGFSGTDSVFASFEIVLVTASYILLLMGIMKGLFGIFIRRLGIAGTRVIVGPRKIRRYYECELECCTVLFDECGFPVHPTTCLPVQIVPLFVEVLLNFFFFFLYPIRGIMFLIMSCPCCKAVCSDCDGCWQQDDASDVDQKCSRPLLSKKQKKSSHINYNLTTINTKKVKIDECLPYLLYKGDDDPLEDDDTEFVLRELKRYKEK